MAGFLSFVVALLGTAGIYTLHLVKGGWWWIILVGVLLVLWATLYVFFKGLGSVMDGGSFADGLESIGEGFGGFGDGGGWGGD